MIFSLKQARNYRGITQDQMAKQLDVGRDTYINWESNPGRIRINDAKKISEILNLPVSAIFFGEDVYKL